MEKYSDIIRSTYKRNINQKIVNDIFLVSICYDFIEYVLRGGILKVDLDYLSVKRLYDK
jgi:hypothetical protein